MEQLILHLFGDYVTQSDWMANNKTKRFWPAFWHALVYSLPFLFIGSLAAVAVIFVTHFFIDRYRLARFVVYAKNFLAPRYSYECVNEQTNTGRKVQPLAIPNWWPWGACKDTGYHNSRPAWLAVWLLIAADNTLHLAINYAALQWI